MATTTAADLIVPEVWGSAVMAAVKGRSALLPLAAVDDKLVGQPGDTIHFPKYGYIGDADDLSEGVAMVPVKLTMQDGVATIKEIGKAVEITDRAELTALGSPNEQARQQIARAVQRKMDTDLRTAAAATSVAVGTPGTPEYIPASSPIILPTTYDNLNWSEGLTEAIGAFGDEWDPQDIAGIVIHSKQHVSLLRDPDFISLDKGGTAITRGQVGTIAGGVPVIISDRAVVTGVDPDKVYEALVIRKGALGLTYKRRAVVESDRDILRRTDLVTTNVHYAVKRLDDSGVVVIKTKALAPTP